MPNIIISGSPGIGKTTSILCLAHELLGPQYKEAVLELNASDDRLVLLTLSHYVYTIFWSLEELMS